MELIKQNSQTKIIKSLIVIFLGSLILAISAKIKLPFYPVPMTMQTFVVLFLGISFGYKIGRDFETRASASNASGGTGNSMKIYTRIGTRCARSLKRKAHTWQRT